MPDPGGMVVAQSRVLALTLAGTWRSSPISLVPTPLGFGKSVQEVLLVGYVTLMTVLPIFNHITLW